MYQGSALIGLLRIVALGLLMFPLMPVQAVLVALKHPAQYRLSVAFHKTLLRLLNMRVVQHGAPQLDKPTLFVCNHLSYLDIPVLGSLLPASFISKAEVKHWPIFGLLARLQRTVFIERRTAHAKQHASMTAQRLAAGDSLILFPEGTSADGVHVLPFKSSIFAALDSDATAVSVQPVSLAVTGLGGLPLGRHGRNLYAWYGDMTLMQHLWRMFKTGFFVLQVEFHPPVTLAQFASRKALAQHCRTEIVSGMALANAGRVQEAAPHRAMSAHAAAA